MHRLTRDQFRDALRKGLGRAILHLRQFGPAGMEDEISNACVRSLVYDALCEGTRGDWFHEIVNLAGLSEMVVPQVIENLLRPSKAEDFWQVGHLYSLAAAYAEDGRDDARRAMYDKFDRREFSEGWLGGIQITAVDGVPGFLHVAGVIGDRLRNEQGFSEDGYLFWDTSERLGRETVENALAAEARVNENIRAFAEHMDAAEQQEEERKTRGPRPLEKVESVLQSIESAQDKYPHRLKFWGRRASEEDLAVIFDRMLTEDRPEQLHRYLCVFGMREMPNVPQRILDLTDTEDKRLLNAAICVLSNVRAAEIRDLGLRMLKHRSPRLDAIRLFAKNYEPGDSDLLASVLPTEGDADTLHGIGLDLLTVVGEVKKPELANTLFWLYEHGPCSMCRENAVRYLIEMKALGRDMAEECLWDCCEDTRDLGKSALAEMQG
jgi:hypothetical protein